MTGVADPESRSREVQKAGVSLVLYHRSIDEELTEKALWDDKACATVRAMCALGLDVAIAGGVTRDVFPMLRGVPIYGIVIGRGITAQPNPAEAASLIQKRMKEIWPS